MNRVRYPLSPHKVAQNTILLFCSKIQLRSKNVCYKVSLCENVQGQSCSYIISLCESPSTKELRSKWPTPFRKRRFWQISLDKRKRKGRVFLYSAFYILCISQSAQAWITQFLPANTPCLPFLSTRSSDGATSNWGKRHPTAAYYSSIDPEGMKGWVGLVGWPTAEGLPT